MLGKERYRRSVIAAVEGSLHAADYSGSILCLRRLG
jgi:hypothetical protein